MSSKIGKAHLNEISTATDSSLQSWASAHPRLFSSLNSAHLKWGRGHNKFSKKGRGTSTSCLTFTRHEQLMCCTSKQVRRRSSRQRTTKRRSPVQGTNNTRQVFSCKPKLILTFSKRIIEKKETKIRNFVHTQS